MNDKQPAITSETILDAVRALQNEGNSSINHAYHMATSRLIHELKRDGNPINAAKAKQMWMEFAQEEMEKLL